jgi:predicted Fe-S protein YdhL (DUF1289 family)
MPDRSTGRDRPAAPRPSAVASAAVPSPCTGVCRIDPRNGLCAGCLRSLDEIAAWPDLDAAGRLALRRQLRARRAAHAAADATDGPGLPAAAAAVDDAP